MKCPICAEEVAGQETQKWGMEFAHTRCIKAYSLGGCDARAELRAKQVADIVEATRDAMRGDILARQREQHAKSFPQVTDMRWRTEELGYVGRLIDRLILPPQAQSESDIRALHAEVASMLYLLRSRQTKWLSDEQISHEALHVQKFGHLGWEGFHAGVHFAERHYGIKE